MRCSRSGERDGERDAGQPGKGDVPHIQRGDGSADDVTESFTYDSSGRLTYWSYNADGSTNDATLSVSYTSSGSSISTNGTRASGSVVNACK